MATVFDMARLNASDYQFVHQASQGVLYDAVKRYLAMANQDRLDAFSFFVSGATIKFKERVYLPMEGYMQRRAVGTKGDAVKRKGSYDVAYPIYDFTDELALTEVDAGYMTPEEFQAHLDGILTRAANTYRLEILTRIFKNTNTVHDDDRNGELTVVPLANTDGTIYPPFPGTVAGADDESYFESSYTAANISDTNNPYSTLSSELLGRFGSGTGGGGVATLINKAQVAVTEALTNFVPVTPSAISAGNDTDTVGVPAGIPGKIIGYLDDTYVSVYDFIPANYMVSIHMGTERPLIERNDPPETGLGGGLRLKASGNEWPIMYQDWSWRFGLGTRNRLNGAVMELGTGGTYTIPTLI